MGLEPSFALELTLRKHTLSSLWSTRLHHSWVQEFGEWEEPCIAAMNITVEYWNVALTSGNGSCIFITHFITGNSIFMIYPLRQSHNKMKSSKCGSELIWQKARYLETFLCDFWGEARESHTSNHKGTVCQWQEAESQTVQLLWHWGAMCLHCVKDCHHV